MDELTIEAQGKMNKTVEVLHDNFATLRTGRASVTILDRVEAEYYGDKMPINQICAITTPEPRQILVKPYDKNDLKSVVNAISTADLGLNPQVDGDCIRIIIPGLTEERRHEIAKKAKSMSEEAKIAVRNIRRDYFDFLKEDDTYSDDLKKRIQDEIQKVTDETIVKIDNAYSTKEKEILTV